MADIESHPDSSPTLSWTARYVDGQLLNVETGRCIWTANWTAAMIRDYLNGLLANHDVKEAVQAVLKCSRILSEAISNVFEERKVFLRSHEYVALCAFDSSQRDHDYERKLKNQREILAVKYAVKKQEQHAAKSAWYVGTFFHPDDVIVKYAERQAQLDKANMTKYKRRARKLILTRAQRITNAQRIIC